jgi:murein DD-endopeptidase MepM/ murein hydrolase activator NlpD
LKFAILIIGLIILSNCFLANPSKLISNTTAQSYSKPSINQMQFNDTSDHFPLEYIELQTSWPLQKNGWIGDLNLTSTFGPRLQASQNFRYDFHRGIDIPTPYGTPVYAIADGIVRLTSINQTHQQRDNGSIDKIYTSTVIQIKHNNTWYNNEKGREYYYSNYLHIDADNVEVKAGDKVIQGQLIGYVGDDPNSNFPHLHFEIRDDGLNQNYATHPLRFLPNLNEDFIEVNPLLGDTSFINGNKLSFEVKVNQFELDFLGFNLNGEVNSEKVELEYDLVKLNLATLNWRDLDEELIEINNFSVIVYPSRYSNYLPYASYNISIYFNNINDISDYKLSVKIYDIFHTGVLLEIENSGTSPLFDFFTINYMVFLIPSLGILTIFLIILKKR